MEMLTALLQDKYNAHGDQCAMIRSLHNLPCELPPGVRSPVPRSKLSTSLTPGEGLSSLRNTRDEIVATMEQSDELEAHAASIESITMARCNPTHATSIVKSCSINKNQSNLEFNDPSGITSFTPTIDGTHSLLCNEVPFMP